MKANHSLRNERILGVAPSTKGFGFAVLERGALIDWGVKSVRSEKNGQSLRKLENLIDHYHPGCIALSDYSSKQSRRAPRIRALGADIIKLANTRNIKGRLISPQDVRRCFLLDDRATKHRVAEFLAKMFPQELASRLPRKRRPWESESYQMGIFEAVALGLTVNKGSSPTDHANGRRD